MLFNKYTEAELEQFFRLSRENPQELRELLKDDPRTLEIIEFSLIKHDPQEDNPQLKPIIRAMRERAYQTVIGIRETRRGDCYNIWAEQKRLLLQCGIDWKTPAEMNPHSLFD